MNRVPSSELVYCQFLMPGAVVTAAMEIVEDHFPPLAGQLPKDYERFEDDVLEEMIRTLRFRGTGRQERGAETGAGALPFGDPQL